MVERQYRCLLLVRRYISRNKPHLLQLEFHGGSTRHDHVSAMNGIEGSAKQCDVHSIAISSQPCEISQPEAYFGGCLELSFIWLEFLTKSTVFQRSEERRVGKDRRSRWSPYH